VDATVSQLTQKNLSLKLTGFEITLDNVCPAKKYLDAMYNFPTPTNITDIRSWFGLVKQASYAFASAEHMMPFRLLLKPNTLIHLE